eukprot:9488549-Pyramimonas_sp.AAC.2
MPPRGLQCCDAQRAWRGNLTLSVLGPILETLRRLGLSGNAPLANRGMGASLRRLEAVRGRLAYAWGRALGQLGAALRRLGAAVEATLGHLGAAPARGRGRRAGIVLRRCGRAWLCLTAAHWCRPQAVTAVSRASCGIGPSC